MTQNVFFYDYYVHQIEWSRQTFGPGLRTGGVIDHIRKELKEIEANPKDLLEWAEDLMPKLMEKQAKNMARTWPDWRTMNENSAIEHVRPDPIGHHAIKMKEASGCHHCGYRHPPDGMCI